MKKAATLLLGLVATAHAQANPQIESITLDSLLACQSREDALAVATEHEKRSVKEAARLYSKLCKAVTHPVPVTYRIVEWVRQFQDPERGVTRWVIKLKRAGKEEPPIYIISGLITLLE